MATPLIFMHDGAVDELVCIPFLESMTPEVELSAVWITPADCLGLPTASACGKILDLIGDGSLQTFLSDSSSERPFPWEYRQYAMMVDLLPSLNPTAGAKKPPSLTEVSLGNGARRSEAAALFHDRLKRASDTAGEPVNFLVTCPMTDLAMMIEERPPIVPDIGEVVWMGGSIKAGGNIDTGIAPGANPNAEWNAYWDPASVRSVLQSGVPLTMFPLDVTNGTALSPSTLQTYFLPEAGNALINLICQMYALVAFQAGFSFWDTLAAAYFGKPELFAFTPTNIDIVVDRTSQNFGEILTPGSGGYPVNVCEAFASGYGPNDFYTYLVAQLKSLPS